MIRINIEMCLGLPRLSSTTLVTLNTRVALILYRY